jgi:hypothetical protein
VIGSEEADWVDFKRDPYQLDTPKGGWELAKDVASFANTRGGVIVIGFDTQRLQSAATDVVTEHRPTRRGLVNGEQLVDLISKRVYPRVHDVRLRWFPESGELAVLVIEVPTQDERQKPFVLEGTLGDDGKLKDGTIGWPRREGARVEWVRAAEIHNLLRDGLTSGQRVVAPAQSEVLGRTEQFNRGSARWDEVVAAMNWGELPHILFQAVPPVGTRGPLRGFHEEGGVRGRFRSPPSLREVGFNLHSHFEHVVREGALTYLADPRRALWLDMDGTFTVGGAGVEDWFGWNLNDGSSPPTPLRLNSLVLTEFALEFLRFVHQVLVPLATGEWLFRARVANLRTPRATALRAGVPDPWMPGEWNSSPANEGEMNPVTLRNSSADAFAFLRWFYALYGLPQTAIPFAAGESVSEALLLEHVRRR